MKVINNCCDSCLHKKVCKNVSSIKTFAEVIKNTIADKNDKLNFTVEISCDDYFAQLAGSNKNGETVKLDLPKPIITPVPFIKKDDPCEGCPTYEMLKNSDASYVGDLPCQWCNKNSYKFTWGLATPVPCNNKATIKILDYEGKCNSYSSNSVETKIVGELK